MGGLFPSLLVGNESADDAAVYQLNETQALIATTDFFTPIVDDPFDFGRIAATNAISDIYAMGGQPIMALALLGMPVGKLSTDVIGRICAGGQSVCQAAGIPLAGGHSIDAAEPIYGLVALGLVHPQKIKRNNQAKPGDVLILGKGLGVGILSAALKKGELKEKSYEQMVAAATQLNTPGLALGAMPGVHALTDVTGFGLLGHLMEICKGSGVAARIDFSKVPILSSAKHLLLQGFATGASERNWQSYGSAVTMSQSAPLWQRKILTDPQTSGGLLVSCHADDATEVLDIFAREGFKHASLIGVIEAGAPQITVQSSQES